MNIKVLLANLQVLTQSTIDFAVNELTQLSPTELDERIHEGEWTIREVLAHLNEFAKYYNSTFRHKLTITKFKTPQEEFISSPLGKSAWTSMKLGNAKNIKRKFKTVKSCNPLLHPELITGNEIERFIAYQTELIELIQQAEFVNLKRVRIPMSISKIVRLRLGDALQFVVYHNERHLQQIKNMI